MYRNISPSYSVLLTLILVSLRHFGKPYFRSPSLFALLTLFWRSSKAWLLACGSCQFWLAASLPELNIRLQLVHHLRELRDIERLRAVANRLLWRRVHFDDQSVGADRHARLR